MQNDAGLAGLGLFGLFLIVAWGFWMLVLSIMIPVMLSNIRSHLARISEQVDRAVNRQTPLPPVAPRGFVLPPLPPK